MSAAVARTSGREAGALHLPQRLDLPAAQALALDLIRIRGAPAVLDASQVRRMGALALQVLLSARKTWAADGQTLTIEHPSPEFRDALALFGAETLGGPPGE